MVAGREETGKKGEKGEEDGEIETFSYKINESWDVM